MNLFLMRSRFTLLLIALIWLNEVHADAPQVVIVIVIDQFANSYPKTLDGHLTGGIHELLGKGALYTNAYLPHAIPATAAGHTSMSTGKLAKEHGIVDNSWFLSSGQEVHAMEGGRPEGLMVDTINTFVCAKQNRACYSFSYKERAAIAMAGRDATAIWFNDSTGQFISSINNLDWLKNFNKTHDPHASGLIWQLTYPDQAHYQFPLAQNYRYASESSVIERIKKQTVGTNFFDIFEKTPASSQLVLDLASTYIHQALKQNPAARLLMWISLSNLDKIGHIFGPDSLEAIDTVYHMDQQLGTFMQDIKKLIAPSKVLFALTADHGVMPIPELIANQGGKRVLRSTITDAINEKVFKQYKIPNVVQAFTGQSVYFDENKLANLDTKQRQAIIQTAMETIRTALGPKSRVYETSWLAAQKYATGTLGWQLQNSIYVGRSGHLYVLPPQYTLITKYKGGTGHTTPYEYDTHIPLILYWPGKIEHKTITEKVWLPQLGTTIAQVLGASVTDKTTLAHLPAIKKALIARPFATLPLPFPPLQIFF